MYARGRGADSDDIILRQLIERQRIVDRELLRHRRREDRMRNDNAQSSSSEEESEVAIPTPQEGSNSDRNGEDVSLSKNDQSAEDGEKTTKVGDKDGDEASKKPAGDGADDKTSKITPEDKNKDADPKKDTKEEKLDPKLVGMSVGLKHLYSGKEDKRGRFQWQTTIPEDVGKPAEDAETQKWALIVRHIKVYNDPSKVLAVHGIVIQSPLLKELLKVVLKGYPGVTVGLERLEFSGKFEALIHRWPQLKSSIDELREKANASGVKTPSPKDLDADTKGPLQGVKHEEVEAQGKSITENDSTSKDGEKADGDKASDKATCTEPTPEENDAIKLKHAELLYDLLTSEFQTLLDSSQDMRVKGVITYEYLWTLFQPGSYIFSKVEGQERVFRLHSGAYGRDKDGNPVFWLTLMYVEYDGTRFGFQKYNSSIRAFNGTKAITSLSSYPLEAHQHKDEVKARLVARGSKLESLAGTHYRSYDGVGWRTGQWGAKEKFTIKGRIIVDTFGWNRFEPNSSIYVQPLSKDALDVARTKQPGGYDDGDDEYGDMDDDLEYGMPIDGHFAEEDDDQRVPLDEEQKLIATHLIRGYALKEKLWLNMYVNAVSEIAFNTRAFDSLVLPESQKELVLGFTSSQQTFRNQFDDVIEGKGRGIILLLSGPPGVGKTLTAESVAEEMRVPLYVMSAGDVGLDSRHIETRLLDAFGMVTRWNAILLLDEADVFLEERSLHEIERNKLVSIFLRVLEYYEGIMFLTTNRVQTFDAAFQSRIHISLDYQELSIESRKQVWKNFLKQHDFVQQTARERGPSKTIASSIKNTPSKASQDADQSKPTTPVVTTDGDPTVTNGNFDGTNDKPDKKVTGIEGDDAAKQDGTTAQDKAATDDAHQLATQPHSITDKEINELSRIHMNGRQIKNVLKTAQLLASRKKESLNKKHIQTVLDVTQHLHNSTRENERTRSSIFT